MGNIIADKIKDTIFENGSF